jgi:hypothetical protein
MSVTKKFGEVLALYRRHGWRLERVLMSAGTRAELTKPDAVGGGEAATFEGVAVRDSDFDAMWFRREAQGGREAWELRLVGEPPFALFELFEPDEAEEDREDVRREMEARLGERAAPTEGGD